jgi:carboxyl-terminal processing protease
MPDMFCRTGNSRIRGVWALLLLCVTSATRAGESPVASASKSDELWRRSVEQVAKGDFSGAGDSIRQVDAGGQLVERVRQWLSEYQTRTTERKAADRVEFDLYVGYAKARMERKEYALALDKALLAADVAESRDEFLRSAWLLDLVNAALVKADELGRKREWRDAWHLYADLGALYERDPRYAKLEREALTHLRLDTMFGDDKQWKERIEKVEWKDAEAALECIGLYYVEAPDFKKVCESGLEQLLLLADSQSAQKAKGLEGLANEDDRRDFKARIQENLDQVRAAPSIDRRACVERFRRAVQKINKETVQLPEELLVSELVRGALEPLDDFTTVIWPQDIEEFDKHTRGDFIGVGISIIKNKKEEIEVVTPLEDTPAFRHGIQAGDIITNVDGASIKDFSLNKVVSTITGIENTPVTLTIRRGEEEIEFPLVRERVKIQSVKGWQRRGDGNWNHWIDEENRIGYIRLTNFQKNTAEDLANAMSELEAKGLRALVLDLRWNPGGLLDSAWQVSSLFLNRGDKVVSTKGRNQGEDQVLTVPGDGPYADVPLVVLVDESSASASEIVSGAVRDNHRGAVIGERTFGKFSVQNLIPLSSSNAKLKITTARYYLPSGVSLHREPTSESWGVEPQIPLRLARWERINAWQLRRDADLLGPPKPTTKKDETAKSGEPTIDPITGDEIEPEGRKAEDAATAKDAEGGEETAEAKEPELPPLEQPDDNTRPKIDPQVDTALLFLRVKLLGIRFPTIANAEPELPANSAKP